MMRGLLEEATFTDMRTLFVLYGRIDSLIPWTGCSPKQLYTDCFTFNIADTSYVNVP